MGGYAVGWASVMQLHVIPMGATKRRGRDLDLTQRSVAHVSFGDSGCGFGERIDSLIFNSWD